MGATCVDKGDLLVDRRIQGKFERIDRIRRRHECSESRSFKWPNEGSIVEILVDDGVFSPAVGEASVPLADALEIEPGCTVLDVGTGSGFLAIVAALKGAGKVVAVDSELTAVQCAEANVRRQSSEIARKISVRTSNLFEAIESSEAFDVVIFNPPFMSDDPTQLEKSQPAIAAIPGWLRSAIFDPGYVVLRKFLCTARKFLKPGGRIMIAFSTVQSRTCVHEFMEMVREFGYTANLAGMGPPNGSAFDFMVYRLRDVNGAVGCGGDSRVNADTGTLRLASFDVEMLYGLKFRPVRREVPDTEQPDGEEGSATDDRSVYTQGGWSPMYRLVPDPGRVRECKVWGGEGAPALTADLRVPISWVKDAYLGPSTFPITILADFLVRRDGIGVLRLCVHAERRADLYTTGDVLALMLLPPRTIDTKSLLLRSGDELSEIVMAGEDAKNLDEPPAELAELVSDAAATRIRRHWSSFSAAYRLAILCVLEFLSADVFPDAVLAWEEFGAALPDDGDEYDDVVAPLYAPCPNTASEGDPFLGDPQIPYMFVHGAVPFVDHRAAFMEEGNQPEPKRRDRGKYTKDIAAILGRWLTPKNIPMASSDYWTGRELLTEGAFRSQYMNSVVFTSFSGMATLCLEPDLADVGYRKLHDLGFSGFGLNLPLQPTRESVIWCLSISRMRWHHVMTLNRQLDQVIALATSRRGPRMVKLIHWLADLRAEAALHLENPLGYMWDATVGSELAEFLQSAVIGELERSVERKIDMVRNLIQDVRDEDDLAALLGYNERWQEEATDGG